ncbi:hypothetical protein EDB84DRAFT_1534536 [Lactarius hengduanensis]|nr:hypothetical protein EDB84DRAFT_1534536 [Lactarius hengduanensis]
MPKVPTLTPRAKHAQALALKKQEDALAAKRLEEEMAASVGGSCECETAFDVLMPSNVYRWTPQKRQAPQNAVWKKKDIQDDGPAHQSQASSGTELNNIHAPALNKGVATKPRPSAITGNKRRGAPGRCASSVSKTVMPANAIPVKVKGTVLPAKTSRRKTRRRQEDADDYEDVDPEQREFEVDFFHHILLLCDY